jgi:hypothetical protein
MIIIEISKLHIEGHLSDKHVIGDVIVYLYRKSAMKWYLILTSVENI